jgi:excisionase family DNA binding protein
MLSPHEGKPASVPRLGFSVEEAASASNCGRTTIFQEIREGRLKARKIGRRTIILDEDLRAWLAALRVRKPAGGL